MHPMPGKGHNIPGDNKPDKTPEFWPACPGYFGVVEVEQEISHAGYKEKMTNFMRDQALGAAVGLDGPGGKG